MKIYDNANFNIPVCFSLRDIIPNFEQIGLKLADKKAEERQKLLTCLNCMRMVSDSTYILNQETNYGNKIGEIKELIKEITENAENKIVIFSQWKRMFKLLIRELEEMDIPFVYLNGDVPASQRKVIIERFQSDHELKIFLSTDAGGVGVNLQRGNILINVDLPWNPAVLEQRIGRIYRLGQTKHINVFNFISAGSIEHRILYLLEFKKLVFAGVIEEEGEDQVMLEGFLESVKAMTEVDIELPGDNAGKNVITGYQDNLAAEANARYLQGSRNNDEPMQETGGYQEQESNFRNEPKEKQKQGILGFLGKKVRRFLKRVFRL